MTWLGMDEGGGVGALSARKRVNGRAAAIRGGLRAEVTGIIWDIMGRVHMYHGV